MNSTKPGNNRQLDADIVIIGSGGGVAAAVAAAENGVKDIIVLEKQARPGGNTALAGGLFGCESPVQKRKNIISNRDEYFKKVINWAHCNRVDPRIVRAYINKSGDTIHWLEGKGLQFEVRNTLHLPIGRGARLMELLIKDCEDMGVQLFLNTSGKRILRGEKGEITGVIAERDGKEFEIKARCAIIATGGFSSNTELLEEYCPDYYNRMQAGKSPYHTGEGLLMAAEIGAAIADSIPISHQGPVPEANLGYIATILTRNAFTVWVNSKGKRFIDESGYSHWEAGNAIALQPDRVVYTLLDDDIRQNVEKAYDANPGTATGTGMAELFGELKKRGEVKESGVKTSGSWEEIADWMQAEPEVLKATIKEYNACCELGYDAIFVKDPEYLLPLRQAPYYAIRCTTSCGETLGGIKINERMEVLDTQGKVVPGLYTAGVIADGWQSQTYCVETEGSTFGFAINSGRIAGENAARFISETIPN